MSSLHSYTRLPQGANCVLQTAAIGVPGEITAASILVTYWDSNVSIRRMISYTLWLIVRNQFNHLPIYITLVIIFVIAVNFLGAKYFGEGKSHVFLLFGIILLTRTLSRVRICDREA